jgi:phosphoglycerol transferase
MKNTAYKKLKLGDRRNLLIFIGDKIEARKVDNPGSMIDVAPTLIGALGGSVKGFGFGRNLLSDEKTFMEVLGQYGESYYLKMNRGFYSTLWEFPKIEYGYKVDLENKQIILGDRRIRFPSLILLDQNLDTSGVKFEFNSNLKLYNQVMELDPDQNFIWTDRCYRVENVSAFKEEIDATGICTVFGSLASHDIRMNSIDEDNSISFYDISRFFGRTNYEEISLDQ